MLGDYGEIKHKELADEERSHFLNSPPHAHLTTPSLLSYTCIPNPVRDREGTEDDLPRFQETEKHLRASNKIYGLGESVFESPLAFASPPTSRKTATYLASLVMILSLAAISLFSPGITGCLGYTASGIKHSDSISSTNIQRLWGAYSPYYSAEPYQAPPDNCQINQVNIIQRHGARVPTSGASSGIITAVNKLLGATSYTGQSQLEFLTNYTYTLGGNGDLLPLGGFQSEESGIEAYKRYSSLISKKNIPFVRSSSGVRVVESATNWTRGFALASNNVYRPPVSVIISESGNNTLDDNLCPNSGSSDAQSAVWASIYATPIADKLNTHAPGANLTADDIPRLMSLCAFESIAQGSQSPWCALFSAKEFEDYEYFVDVSKYYGTGPAAPLGRIQGVGYVNELLARLTGTPVSDATQTNTTLDSSPVTFPLNRTLYADFSHDNQMVAIYTAIGLFKQKVALDLEHLDAARTWVVSRLTPFSGRMVVERLTCIGYQGASYTTGGRAETFVRILVNDALQPLEFCGANRHGLCTLRSFVESQAYSRNNGEGDFEQCFN